MIPALFLLLTTMRVTAVDLEYPLIQSLSYFPFASARGVQPSSWAFDWHGAYSNIFTYTHDKSTLSDLECFSNTFSLRVGFNNGWTGEVYLRFLKIMGGGLDKLIEDFHEKFDLPEAGRNLYPRDKVNYYYHERFNYTSSQSCFSPLMLGVMKEYPLGENGAFFGRLALGIPLSSIPGLSSGKMNLTAGLGASYQKNGFTAQWSGYISWFPEPQWLAGENIRTHMIFSEARIKLEPLSLGISLRTSPFIQGDVASTGFLMNLGFKIMGNVELGVTEDFPPFNTSPDIGFYLHVTM